MCPAYLAPEQRQGEECTAQTDIYALGLILYKMATGKRAPQDGTRELDAIPEKARAHHRPVPRKECGRPVEFRVGRQAGACVVGPAAARTGIDQAFEIAPVGHSCIVCRDGCCGCVVHYLQSPAHGID